MQLQLPMVVGKKVTEVEKEEKKEVETMKLRWEQSRSYCSYIIEILPQDKLQPGLIENLPSRSVMSNKENEVGNTICIIIHINI